MSDDIVVLSGTRTAIGTFGGALAGVPPTDLGATVTRAALDRAGLAADRVGHVVFGHVINTEPRDMYLSRMAAMGAGLPETVPAMNVNRLCGSGAQAVVSAAQALRLGDAEFAVAGRAGSMSRLRRHRRRAFHGPDHARYRRGQAAGGGGRHRRTSQAHHGPRAGRVVAGL